MVEEKNSYITKVESRLSLIFNAYRNNKDIAPAVLFRTEGFIEAGCEMGLITKNQATDLIATAWSRVFEQAMPESNSKLIHIPTAMPRAPVYPSTPVDN
jgi:hypothetical protein